MPRFDSVTFLKRSQSDSVAQRLQRMRQIGPSLLSSQPASMTCISTRGRARRGFEPGKRSGVMDQCPQGRPSPSAGSLWIGAPQLPQRLMGWGWWGVVMGLQK